jgi:hypothetical protein
VSDATLVVGEQLPPTVAIGAEPGTVLMVFDRPVDHVGLDPDSAVQVARQLCEQAKVAGLNGTAFVMQGNGANFAAQLESMPAPKTLAQVTGEGKSEEFGWTFSEDDAHYGYLVWRHSKDTPVAIFVDEGDAEAYCVARNRKRPVDIRVVEGTRFTDDQIDGLWIGRRKIHGGQLLPQLRDLARAVETLVRAQCQEDVEQGRSI